MKTLRAGLCVMPILAVGGCAINPGLPDERRVSIAALVEHVQCEMRAAYSANVGEHSWLSDWAAVGLMGNLLCELVHIGSESRGQYV